MSMSIPYVIVKSANKEKIDFKLIVFLLCIDVSFIPPFLGIPFSHTDGMIQCCKALTQAGFAASGREQLYSGVSGEPLDGLAFIGCVQYQRLRHMVVDMDNVSKNPRGLLNEKKVY
jgi:hypothetical protein